MILLTAYAGWESAKEAIQLGAVDYFEKGREPDELLHRIDRALGEKALRRENANLRAQVRDRYAPARAARRAPRRWPRCVELVRRVAPTSATVLIQGESGTGKEVIAKAIHHASPRARGPFVAINCGALPETLLESELFGHVRGAFTGRQRRPSRGCSRKPTAARCLLDEIGEMPPSLQVKLLRALQSGEIRPVGSTQAITVDVRVVAATNRDLAAADPPGRLPRRPLLSPQRDPGHAAAAARAPRGHPAPRRALPRPRRPAPGPASCA